MTPRRCNPLFPDRRFPRITDIEPSALVLRGVRGVILDVDNTLTTHNNPRPADGVPEWLNAARAAGLRLIILSNNRSERVAPFAGMLGLEFVSDGRKPLAGGFLRACARMGVERREAAAIGDQLFTDILGARYAGIFCCLVDPIEAEGGSFFRLKRRLEKPILRAYDRRVKCLKG